VAAHGRLDELGQRLAEPARRVSFTRALRRGQRLGITGQAVVQQRECVLERGRPVRDVTDPRLAAQSLDVIGCGTFLVA